MPKTILIPCLAALIAAIMIAVPSPAAADMPDTLEAGDYALVLNGTGERVQMGQKIYSAGLYLPESKSDPETIMSVDEPMTMRLEIMTNTRRVMFLNAFRNGMRSAAGSIGADWSDLEDRYEIFTGFIEGDLERGSVIVFEYLPEQGLSVLMDGEHQGTIEGMDFKTAFFGIWLNGFRPADASLKKALLGQSPDEGESGRGGGSGNPYNF